jgi:hypothetical protein
MLNNNASVNDHNTVKVENRIKSMGNRHNSPVAKGRANDFLNDFIRIEIHAIEYGISLCLYMSLPVQCDGSETANILASSLV